MTSRKIIIMNWLMTIRVFLPTMLRRIMPPTVASMLAEFTIAEPWFAEKVPAYLKMVEEYKIIALMPVSCWNMAKVQPTHPDLRITGSQNASPIVRASAWLPPSCSATPTEIWSSLCLISCG